MKRQFFLGLIFIGIWSCINGQNQREYGYDDAGNRIWRKVIGLSSPAPPPSSPGQKSLDGKNTDSVFYTDKAGDILLKIFPNPTASTVTLQIEGEVDEVNGTVMLYSLSGAKTGEQRISSYRTEIDMRSYPVGAYLVTVVINGKTTYWKIVKK